MRGQQRRRAALVVTGTALVLLVATGFLWSAGYLEGLIYGSNGMRSRVVVMLGMIPLGMILTGAMLWEGEVE